MFYRFFCSKSLLVYHDILVSRIRIGCKIGVLIIASYNSKYLPYIRVYQPSLEE